jgi:hypothetical protein
MRMRIRCHLAWRRTQFFPAESARRVRTWCGGHSVKVFSRTGGVPCAYSEFDMMSLGRASVYATRCSASRGSSQFLEIRCSRSEESWMRRKLGRSTDVLPQRVVRESTHNGGTDSYEDSTPRPCPCPHRDVGYCVQVHAGSRVPFQTDLIPVSRGRYDMEQVHRAMIALVNDPPRFPLVV